MAATETPVTDLTVYSDPALVAGKAVLLHDKNTGDAIRFDAEKLVATAKDLSMFTVDGTSLILRETANCYVVRTPGVYKFPVVYGNGIKRGVANTPAYTRQGSTYTADFVNHLGNIITSPYIEKNANCQPRAAGLLWQTGQSLITSVSLVEGGDCKYIQFTVGSVPATNGNAVLYVLDSGGNIMWSWHIWLTSDSLGPEIFENNTEVQYPLMSENLGAMWNPERTRSFNPHYQWGRKDPMAPPASYSSSSQMTLYDINNNVYTGFGVLGADSDQLATKTVPNAIKNPNLFFTRYDQTSHNWNNLTWFNNFWNAAETSSSSLADNQESAVKTIYDPCPIGFMLPSVRAFPGFTTTGGTTEDATQFNVVGSWINGWNFKKTSADEAGNMFPASGYRNDGSGALAGVSGGGDYWSFAPHSQTSARYLYFDSGYVYPLYNDGRSYGFSVRPCREY